MLSYGTGTQLGTPNLFNYIHNPHLIRLLVNAGTYSDINHRNIALHFNTLLHVVADAEEFTDRLDIPMLKFLVESGADPTVAGRHGNILLHIVAMKAREEKDIEFMVSLLDSNTSINAKGYNGRTPLHMASHYWSKAAVRVLIDHGATIDARDLNSSTPLILSLVKNKNSTIARMLIEAKDKDKADVNAMSNEYGTPLHLAMTPEIVQMLYKAGANLNTTFKGDTPLHRALYEGNLDVAVLLIELGARLDIANHCGKLPLHLACRSALGDIIEILLAKGRISDINYRSGDGRTPFQDLVWSGQTETIARLLNREQFNININSADGSGSTALHEAAHRGDTETVELLLKKGALPSLKDNDGVTPLNIAQCFGFTSIVALLEKNISYREMEMD